MLVEQDVPDARVEILPEPQPRKADDTVSFVFTALVCIVRMRILIVVVTAAAMLVGIAISFMRRPRFMATAKLMTPQQTPSLAALMMTQMMNSGGVPPSISEGVFGFRDPNEIYIGLLNARPIADAIVRQFRLDVAYHTQDMTVARRLLANNTRIFSERSGIISINVTDTDKQRAAQLANAYAEQLSVLSRMLMLNEATQRRKYYEEELKLAREDLIAAELAFRQQQRRKGIVQLDSQAKAVIAGQSELRAQIAAKEVQLQALRTYSTEHNPEVTLLENELSSLRQQESRFAQGDRSLSLGLGLEDVADHAMEYLRAEHELQYRQTLLDLLTRQYDAAKLDQARQAIVIRVIEPAIPPVHKVSPKRTLIVFEFTLVGCVMACLYAYLISSLRVNGRVATYLMNIRSEISAG